MHESVVVNLTFSGTIVSIPLVAPRLEKACYFVQMAKSCFRLVHPQEGDLIVTCLNERIEYIVHLFSIIKKKRKEMCISRQDRYKCTEPDSNYNRVASRQVPVCFLFPKHLPWLICLTAVAHRMSLHLVMSLAPMSTLQNLKMPSWQMHRQTYRSLTRLYWNTFSEYSMAFYL